MDTITATTPSDKLDDQCKDYNTPLGHSGSTDQYKCCSVCGNTANRDYAKHCTAAHWAHRTLCNMEYNQDGNAPLPAGYECDAGPTAMFDGQWEDDNDNKFPGPDCTLLDSDFAAGRDAALVWADFKGEDKTNSHGQMAEANTFLIRVNVAGAQTLLDQAKVKCVILLEPLVYGVVGAFDSSNTPTQQAVSTTSNMDIRVYNPSLMSPVGLNMTDYADGAVSLPLPNPLRSTFVSGKVTVVGGYSEAEIALLTSGEAKIQGFRNVGKVVADGAADVLIADTINTGQVEVSNSNAKMVNVTNGGTVSVTGGTFELYDTTSTADSTVQFSGGTVTVDGVTNAGSITFDGTVTMTDVSNSGTVTMSAGSATATGMTNDGVVTITGGAIDLTFTSNAGQITVSEGVTGTATLSAGGVVGSCSFPSTVTLSGGFDGMCGASPSPSPAPSPTTTSPSPSPAPSPTTTSPSPSPAPSPTADASPESSPPPPPPLVSYIDTAFTASGEVSDYSQADIDAIKGKFAGELTGVDAADVVVTIVSGSVTISVSITVPAATAAAAVTTLSTGLMASPSALESSLVAAGVSLTVAEITATPQVAASPPPSPMPPAGPPASPPPDEDDGAPCFPSSATVVKADGSLIRVDALKEGDAIVAATMDGALTTDTISLLSIAKPEVRNFAFLTLTTADAKNLTLTPGHHVPVGAVCCATLKKVADVSVGETVWTVKAGAARADVVAKVTKEAAAGLHSPVLTAGSFPVVDGVVTSFDSIEKVTLAKYGLAPLLAACKATGTCASFREMFLGADREYVA